MTVRTALVAALASTLVLAALHAAAGAINHRLDQWARPVASVAGGVSVSYVFLHLLPEISGGQEELGRVLEVQFEESALAEAGVFLCALAGFVVLYGLERLAQAHNEALPGPTQSGAAFGLHVGVFTVYNGLITYTMATRFRTGAGYAVLFTAAMGLHFLLTDRSLREHFPDRFRRYGRAALVGALVAGWVLSAVFAPTQVVVVVVLTATLGGFVLFNVFNNELPTERRARYPWFVLGVVVYSAALLVTTAIEG